MWTKSFIMINIQLYFTYFYSSEVVYGAVYIFSDTIVKLSQISSAQ